MATIHMSETDAARDFAGLIARVRAGDEILIENGAYPPVSLRSGFPAPRTISESIEIARRLEQETGEAAVLDPDFVDDVAEIVEGRRRIGFMKGRGSVGPGFFDPLPEDELRLWNGEGE
jgi:hypothetical protein